MAGDLAVTVTAPAASAVLAAPAFLAEWSHTRASDGQPTTQNDYRVRIFGTSDLSYQTVTADATQAPGTQASDDANSGTVAWSDPGNVVAQDETYAVAENEGSAPALTEYLKLTNFGFNLPAVAEVLGIEVLGRRKSTNSAPAFVGASEGHTTVSGGTITIPKPSGVVAGDLLLYLGVQRNEAFNEPDGFMSLGISIQGGSTNVRAELAYKVATASEPSSYQSTGFDSSSGAMIAAYRNVLPPTNPNQYSLIGRAAELGNTALSVTAPAADSLLVGLWLAIFGGGTDYWSTPNGMSRRYDDGEGGLVVDQVVAAGPTGDRASQYDRSERAGMSLIALEPARAFDDRISLVLSDGSIGTANRAKEAAWSSADETVIWGHSADTWDEVGLTGADVNDSDFGVVISAMLAGAVEAMLDQVQIRVTYRYANQLLVVTSPLYDSGQTASATGEHAVPANSGIRNNQTYYLRVDVTDTDGLEGASDLIPFSTDWTPPPTITGLTVTPVGGTAVVGGGS